MFFTKRASFALMAGVVGSIGGLLFGYDLGVISGALSSLSQRFSLSILQQEFVTSVLYLGCVVGSLFGGFVCDYVGRKRCVFLICILFISASLILFFANGMAMLIFGRFLVGIGVAISAIADVAYLTEISPIEYRGALVSCNELMITVGLLLAFVIDYVFDSVHDGWRFMLGFPIVLSSIWMFLMSFMPESPRWLLVQDRCDDAYSVFLDICNSPEEASTEFQQAKDNINALSSSGSSLKSEDNSLWSIVLNWKLSLLVSIFLMTLQNFSGQSAILTYSATFFEIAGFGSRASLFASVVLGVVKVVSTIFSLFAVDKCGRKRLLLYGILGMILSLFCVIMILYFGTNGATIRLDSSTHLSTVSAMLLLICICTFVAFYAIGFGPITWLLSSELFSDEIRGRTLGIATLSNWIASLIVVSSFLSCVQSFGFLGTLTMYWILLVCGFIFVFSFIPETKMKEVDTIVKELHESFAKFSCCNFLSNSRSGVISHPSFDHIEIGDTVSCLHSSNAENEDIDIDVLEKSSDSDSESYTRHTRHSPLNGDCSFGMKNNKIRQEFDQHLFTYKQL